MSFRDSPSKSSKKQLPPELARAESKTEVKQPEVPALAKYEFVDFGDEFSPEGFIEKATENLLRFNKKNNKEFDPQQFQNLFQDAITQLRALRDDTDRQVAALVESSREAEEEHMQRMSECDHKLSGVFVDFKKLDKRISKIATTAVRIGDNLETVDQQQERSVRGKELIQYFLEFNSGNPERLSPLFSDPKRLHECAAVLQQLQPITQDLQIRGVEKAIELIVKKTNEVENKLLDQFAAAAAKENTDAMKVCAKTLLNFQGASIIKRYVFNAIEQLGRQVDFENTSVSNVGLQIAGLFRDILATCRRETNLICRVFPHPERVIKMLLERIFEEKIFGFLDAELTQVPRSNEEQLLILELAHDRMVELVASLQELLQSLPASPPTSTSASVAAAASSASSGAKPGAPTATMAAHIHLQELMESIFCRYREQYLINETQLLDDLCVHQIHELLVVFDNKALHERDFFGRRKKESAEEMKRLIKNVLDSDLVDRILQADVVSLSRCDKLADPGQLPNFVHRIFSTVVQKVGVNFMLRLVDLSLELLPEPEPKVEPDTFFLTVSQGLNDAAQKMELHFQRIVAPRMESSPNVQSLCAAEKRELMSRIEGKIQRGLSTHLQASCYWIGKQLSNHQNRTDFRPKSEMFVPDEVTKACEVVTEFISAQFEVIVKSLDGRNLDLYLTFFGNNIYSLILTHLKKYTFSTSGALVLLRDVKEYQEVIREFQIPALNQSFEILRSVSNLFLVTPDTLSSVVQKDVRLSKMDVQEISTLLKLRADYKSAHLQQILL